MFFLSHTPFQPSQTSQTRMAVGQHAIFKPSQQPLLRDGWKIQETRMAVSSMTLVTVVRGVKQEEREKERK